MGSPRVGTAPVRRNAVWPLIDLAAAAVLLAACSSSTGGVATPTPTSSTAESPSPGGLTTRGSTRDSDDVTQAPTVVTALNASPFVAHPCAALTTSQLAGITLTNLHILPDNAAGNPLCAWADETTGDSVGVTWMSATTQGLSQVYAQRVSQGYFTPTTVDQYPAVYADFADLRAQGTCSLNVGVSNTLYFIAKYDSEHTATRQQACQLIAQVATDVITNLGGRNHGHDGCPADLREFPRPGGAGHRRARIGPAGII